MTTDQQRPKKRLLTGDTPTGKLHLGHWVGTLENRVRLQNAGEHDCYFIIANLHAYTTRPEQADEIRKNTIDVACDYLAAGIDPEQSSIFLQSEVPAIHEITMLLSMLIPHARVMRNPTLKQELAIKGLTTNFSFGFALYPVGQTADILAFRPSVIPVGEDQLPHLEMTNEVARRFNQVFCGVDPHKTDAEQIAAGGIFNIPAPLVGRVRRLVGLGGPDAEGRLMKMSKSLSNAIYLSDSPDQIKDKVMSMYTDPQRLRATDKGTVENNPLWIFHDAFNHDKKWVKEAKTRYENGEIGDVECKKRLVECIVELTQPMRMRRAQYEREEGYIREVLYKGSCRANAVAEETLEEVKKAAGVSYFKPRRLALCL